MRKIVLICLCLFLYCSAFAETTSSTEEDTQSPMDVINDHLRELKVNNMDYIRTQSKMIRRSKKNKEKRDVVQPFALIFTGIDPDCSPEIIFQQNKKTLYAVRSPGLIVNDEVLAGIEQTIKLHDIPLIVVMGHTPDPLMKQACEGFSDNYSSIVIAKLQPAVQAARVDLPDSNCLNDQMQNSIIKHNMLMSVAKIVKQSPEVEKRIKLKTLKIVGAIVDHSTNQVEFFDSM